MSAEVALSRGVVIGIDVESIVRASLHARFATNAAPVVEIHDSIGAPVERASRTNFRARRVIAVIASHHPEVPRRMREFALLDMLDPGAKYAHRHLVFFFARDRAGVTPNATVLIDDESVSHLLNVNSPSSALEIAASTS
jgi:hypothetical protein